MSKIDFWKDPEKKILNPLLYSDEADKKAIEIKDDYVHSGKKMNKRTQIRKFYDEVSRFNTEAKKLNLEKENDLNRWNDILPMVHMLTAKAAYARGRGLVSDGFFDLIKTLVKQVKTPNDLFLFANFFEAFMGFYRLHVPKE